MSTCFLARKLALFEQFVDDAGSVDSKKQDLKVAQSAKDDNATVPVQHQFELPVDFNDDVEMFPMPGCPHYRDVMPNNGNGCNGTLRLIATVT